MFKTLLICGTALLIAGVHFNNQSALVGMGIFMMTIAVMGAVTNKLFPFTQGK